MQGLLHNDTRSNSSNSDGNSRNIKCTLVAQEVAALEGHVANPNDCNSTGDTALVCNKACVHHGYPAALKEQNSIVRGSQVQELRVLHNKAVSRKSHQGCQVACRVVCIA